MTNIDILFLQALRAALKNEYVTWDEGISPSDWKKLFHMASVHHVLPLIYEAVFRCPDFSNADPNQVAQMKYQMIQQVSMQTMKTSDFLRLYAFLTEKGFQPLVVKGIVCRSLYPNPDYRMSGDEDLLIPEGTYALAHRLFTEYGMEVTDPRMDIEESYEVPYSREHSPLYIELHKSLFNNDAEPFGVLNHFFTRAFERAVPLQVEGGQVMTMGYTDHLLYLICHAFKHFLHGGFGLRQVADINMYANAYGSQIDWKYLLECCREIRADLFAASLFKIGERYLTFEPERAAYPWEWRSLQVDESEMLADLLASGVYGQAEMSRKHSSNITLSAVVADRRGHKAQGGRSVLRAVFLPAKNLENRFTYLKKYPFLLPIAWVQRVVVYRKETRGNAAGNNAVESIRIGHERVELLRKYGIIK